MAKQEKRAEYRDSTSFGEDCRKKYKVGRSYEMVFDNGYDSTLLHKKVKIVWIHPRGRFAVGEYDTPLGKVKMAVY